MKNRSMVLMGILIISSTGLIAQIQKGATIFGGNIRFFKQKYDITVPQQGPKKQTNFDFGPSYGKAIQNNLIAGIGVNLAHADSKNINDIIDSKLNTYELIFFLRKYAVIGKNFYLFLQGNIYASYEIYNNHRISESETTKDIGAGLDFTPGISYALNNKLHLEFGLDRILTLYYLNEIRTVKDPSDITTIHFKMNGVGLQSGLNLNSLANLSIGFRILINK